MVTQRFTLAVFFGAVASFLWGFVSWTILDWHAPKTFKDEAAVAAVLKANAPEHGFYMLPTMDNQDAGGDAKEPYVKLTDGPYFNGVVRPGKLAGWSLGWHMGQSFLRSLLACLVLAFLASRCHLTGVPARMAFGALAGFFVTCAAPLQSAVWFELPTRDLLIALVDNVAEWTLVGGVFAFILPNPRKN